MRRSNPLVSHWRVVLGVIVVFVVIAAAVTFYVRSTLASPQQPIAFTHKVMVGAGVPCLYCHDTAYRSKVASIPSVQKCMGCHTVINPTNPEIQKVAAYWQKQEPIPWVRVYQLPRFVHFTHEVHITAGGQNCEACHGDVSQMTIAVAAENVNMGFCLGCHERQANAQQLKDCVLCHK